MIGPENYFGHYKTLTLTGVTSLIFGQVPVRNYRLVNNSGSSQFLDLPNPSTMISRWLGMRLFFHHIGPDEVRIRSGGVLQIAHADQTSNFIFLGVDALGAHEWYPSERFN